MREYASRRPASIDGDDGSSPVGSLIRSGERNTPLRLTPMSRSYSDSSVSVTRFARSTPTERASFDRSKPSSASRAASAANRRLAGGPVRAAVATAAAVPTFGAPERAVPGGSPAAAARLPFDNAEAAAAGCSRWLGGVIWRIRRACASECWDRWQNRVAANPGARNRR